MAEGAAGGFDIRRLLLLGGVVLVVVVASIFILFRSCGSVTKGSGNFTVIYSNLDLKDAANVVARLKELNVSYELRDDGQAIAVAKDKADQARLGLAEKNLPAGGVVGWEIFDESKLGATDFDRRIQLIRAISGELSRTIRGIQGVDDVRVQIVIPETRLFAASVAPVTASVLLRLKPGAELERGKINGIVHLVASSVENLQPENVTVVENTGRILNAAGMQFEEEVPLPKIAPPLAIEKPVPAAPLKTVMATQEATVEAKAVTVEATSQTVASREGGSLEALVLVRPLTTEEARLLRVRAKKELEDSLSGKAQEILNRFYPPNAVIVKVNAEVKFPLGVQEIKMADLKVSALNAIVLVDNRISMGKELKQATFKSTAAAIGYVPSRGDKIILQKVPFHLATPVPESISGEGKAAASALTRKPFFPFPLLLGISGAAVILLAIFLLGGRLWKKPRFQGVTLEARQEVPPPPPPPASRPPSVVDNIKSFADTNPEKVAELLRSWLTEK